MTADELLALLPADLEAELRLGGARRSGLALRVERRPRGTPTVALVRFPPVFGPEGARRPRSLEADVLVEDVLELAVLAADVDGYIPDGLLGAALSHLEPKDAVLALAVRVAALSSVSEAALALRLPLLDPADGATRGRR